MIIISAKNDYENKIRGLHAGADDSILILKEPVDLETILGAVMIVEN